MKQIKLEVGHKYLSRLGNVRLILRKEGKMYIADNGREYYKNGWVNTLHPSVPLQPPRLLDEWHPYDLVREVTP